MQITRKALYAIRALIFIASAQGEKLCTITQIAESEGIPREYMAKILKELTMKGFLASYRGVRGGYRLRKDVHEISFLDILEAMQGTFKKDSDNVEDVKLYEGAAEQFWTELYDMVKTRLSQMGLDKIDYMKFYPDRK